MSEPEDEVPTTPRPPEEMPEPGEPESRAVEADAPDDVARDAQPAPFASSPRPVAARSAPRFAALTEMFTKRRAMAVAASLGEPTRAKLERGLTLGTQKADAAETLWQNGHSAEGLRLAVESLDATLATLGIYAEVRGLGAGGDAEEIRAAALRDRGLSPKAIASIAAAHGAAREISIPEHERDVVPAHTSLWRDIAGAQHLVARAMGDAARTTRELRLTRLARIVGATLALLIVVTGIVLVTRTPEGVFIEASAVWANSDAFSAEKAMDGRDDTWWLAPEGEEASLEVTISPPRRVQRIRLLNGWNPPFYDRGTRAYRLEVRANGRVARTIEGTLEHARTGEPEFVEHEIGLDGVEGITFTARSHHAIGAGLAELQIE